MRNQPAGVIGQLSHQMGKIDRDTSLQLVKDHQIGKTARQHAVQGSGAIDPRFSHFDAITTINVDPQFAFVTGTGFKSGTVNDAIDRIFDTIDDNTVFGDALNALLPTCIKQFNIRAIECRQILVVETRPFAHLVIPWLKGLCGYRISNDRLNPGAHFFHCFQIEQPFFIGRNGQCIGIVTKDFAETVIDHILARRLPRDDPREILNTLGLPTGLQRLCPFRIGWPVGAFPNSRRRALQNVELFDRFSQARNDLNRCGTRA